MSRSWSSSGSGKTLERLLGMDPDPVPRHLLLGLASGGSARSGTAAAKREIRASRWYRSLESTQLADGTWGRFHTRNSSLKAPYPTTEIAVSCALGIGLDARDPLLTPALRAVRRYVDGKELWTDRPEKHDNPAAWPAWVRHVSAGVLAFLDPLDPRLPPFRELWMEVLEAAFSSGSYDRRREIAAIGSLIGFPMRDPMPFHRKYPLLILSSGGTPLPRRLEDKALSFVERFFGGIYYVYEGRIAEPQPLSSRKFWGWLEAQRLLSRFPGWRGRAEAAAERILGMREEDGLWRTDGPLPRRPYSPPFPLSESWKRRENKAIDVSTALLSAAAELSRGAG